MRKWRQPSQSQCIPRSHLRPRSKMVRSRRFPATARHRHALQRTPLVSLLLRTTTSRPIVLASDSFPCAHMYFRTWPSTTTSGTRAGRIASSGRLTASATGTKPPVTERLLAVHQRQMRPASWAVAAVGALDFRLPSALRLLQCSMLKTQRRPPVIQIRRPPPSRRRSLRKTMLR